MANAAWHHFIILREGTRLTVYHNGASAGTDIDAKHGENLGTGSAWICNDRQDKHLGVPMDADDFRVWDRALLDNEIVWLYNAGSGQRDCQESTEVRKPGFGDVAY